MYRCLIDCINNPLKQTSAAVSEEATEIVACPQAKSSKENNIFHEDDPEEMSTLCLLKFSSRDFTVCLVDKITI
jgi:hypothetical protein